MFRAIAVVNDAVSVEDAPAPMFNAVAAPAKFTVVAVVFTSANVVDEVVIGETNDAPAANGIEDVAVCDPSLSRHVLSPVEMSDHVV